MDQQAGTSRKKREKREKAGYSYIENGSRPSEASSFRGVVGIIQKIEGSVGILYYYSFGGGSPDATKPSIF